VTGTHAFVSGSRAVPVPHFGSSISVVFLLVEDFGSVISSEEDFSSVISSVEDFGSVISSEGDLSKTSENNPWLAPTPIIANIKTGIPIIMGIFLLVVLCMVCGYTLYDVGKSEHPGSKEISRYTSQTKQRTTSKKIPIMIGIPVLILVIIGVGASQGLFSDVFDKSSSEDITEPKSSSEDITEPKSSSEDITEPKSSTSEKTQPTETHSKCGKGTIFDPKTNSCVLDK